MKKNAAIAGLLRQIGVLLQEQGIAFKPAAYFKAAKVIEDLPQDISNFKSEKELMDLPGIGEAIAGKILEYRATGRIAALDHLLAEQGGISPDLLMVEDLGPKRARVLQKELGIKTVADLIKAAAAGKLRSLPRFSEVMEKKILENARRVSERSHRFPRVEVKIDVEKLLTSLRRVHGVERAEVAGSYRREKETVGDIDIIVIANDPQNVADSVAALPIVSHVVAHGGTKVSFDLKNALRVDVRFVKPEQWGAALQYFTGDKEHNIALRKRAIQRGWKLNEYGLFDGEKVIASREERDIYEALGLRMPEPRDRTGDIG